ncbi:hypothetical protein Sme01_01600 [Sphaerisporangium melleum]|uniref:Fibronectin type-III domain-containing protein n=1 Tax=Sphaerisporangium melleum TaxID=321316 RepID=A0A917R4C2_9ACTN|nr:hypothetical protein [Sphaerisporangium melleum]GGK88455.1 hypothetical protein GCM10007964_33930 [Sphaerisporangium melleum]GII67684.1 hypothetical protein Sme01_01600 [Sphaerisporangium melleum]
MAFDEQRYTREVLEPAREAGGLPPEDLRVRYQLGESMTAAEVAETVRQVRQCWRRARGMLKYKRLADRLEADHARFSPIFSAAAEGDLGPLRDALGDSERRAARRPAAAAGRLEDAAGRLRMLSPALLATIARSGGVSVEEAVRLAAERGIEVREPDRLPESAPYPGFAQVREALDVLGAPHLGRFLYGARCARMRVLDGFSVAGGAPIADAVAEVGRHWAARSRGPWTVGADTVLAALRGSADPAALVRYDIVARLRERVREHPYDDTLLRHATTELDLDEGDARRLIFAVRGEGGVGGGASARLRELVDAGEIHAAADFAEALEPGALTGEAAELATEVRARLAQAVRLRERARTSLDPDDAWLAVRDALRRVPDLPGAAELLARLAPHPARAVRAAVQGEGVSLVWQPSPSRAGRIVYDVYRDGILLATAERPSARDESPPVNTPVTYWVVARRDEAVAGPALAAPVVVRPEPSDLRLTAGDGVVSGRWTRPADAARVIVSRDGAPIPAGDTGFRDPDVVNGTTYGYTVQAVYADPDGEVVTPGVRRTVTPLGRPRPVTDFTLRPDPSAPGTFVVRYEEPATGVLEIVALDATPPWPMGTTLPLAELRAATRPVPSAPTKDGQSVRPAGGQSVLLAVTVSGELATVGTHVEHVNLAPPARLTAQRRGVTVYVGFVWPPDVPEVEVRWNGRAMIVNAAAYRAQGGVRLDVPEGEPVTVEVAPTSLVRGERVHGAPVGLHLPGRVPVRYDLSQQGPAWKRSVVVEVTADRPVRLRRLALVLKPGHVQPKSADDGILLDDWFDLDVPARLTVPAPRQAKPYWLRCFAEGAAETVPARGARETAGAGPYGQDAASGSSGSGVAGASGGRAGRSGGGAGVPEGGGAFGPGPTFGRPGGSEAARGAGRGAARGSGEPGGHATVDGGRDAGRGRADGGAPDAAAAVSGEVTLIDPPVRRMKVG